MTRLLTGAGMLACCVATFAAAPAACAPATAQTKVNQDARVAREFTARINEYMDLHKGLEARLPTLPKEATPEEIDKHQRALGRMIADARKGAKPGDIFTREMRALFRRYLAAVFSGPDAKQLRASIMDENPGPVKIAVNQRYPDQIPLATMPPQVLEWLPKMPEELEYRFIGRRLILLDVHAHMIVDFIEDALPK